MGVPYPAPLTHLGLHRINWASTDVEADQLAIPSSAQSPGTVFCEYGLYVRHITIT